MNKQKTTKNLFLILRRISLSFYKTIVMTIALFIFGIGSLFFLISQVKADSIWSYDTVDSTGHIGDYASMALGSDGYSRISYYANGYLKFVQCTNTSCSTKNAVAVDNAGVVGMHTSTAIGSDGFARISYYDYSGGNLKFVQCTNASCSTKNITTVDSTGDVGWYTSLALGSDGFARISYYDTYNGDLKFAQCTNASCSTSNITTIDSTGDVGQYTSIALGSDGFARISYYDYSGGNLKFAQCANASCSTKNIATIDSSLTVGQYTSIALGSDGFARISYYHYSSGNLKFAQCTNASCSTSNITTIDSTGNVGAFTSTVIGSDGYARISYYDSTNGDLKFAQCTNASCSTSNITTIDSTGDVGQYTSIVLSSDGYPRIGYHYETGGDLKFAYQFDLQPKTLTNPTSQDITDDITSGYLTVSGTNTEATSATINANYTLKTGSHQYTIPSNTTLTPSSGTMDITALTVSDISNTIQQENSNSKGAIKIGIPNKSVTFSQDITVTMSVNSEYNDKTLTIYSRPDTGGDWTYETTCNVSDSECTFTTDHATEYTGNYEVSNSPTPTDVNVGIDPTISLTCSDNLTLGTITGTGQSNLTTNEAVCTVGTINSSGYQLSWLASTAYMENENGDQIAPYTPQTPATPETWSVASTESEWGGRVKSTSTDPDLTGEEIWDNFDSYSGTWLNVSTDPFVIANRTTETSQAGSTETILFGAEIGSNKFQPTGTYDVDVTFTATTL